MLARIAEPQGTIRAVREGQERMLARLSASSECAGVNPPGARSGLLTVPQPASVRPGATPLLVLDERAPDRAQSALFPLPPGRTDAEPEPVSAHSVEDLAADAAADAAASPPEHRTDPPTAPAIPQERTEAAEMRALRERERALEQQLASTAADEWRQTARMLHIKCAEGGGRGGVDFGFISTTTNELAAVSYLGGKEMPVLFQFDVGDIDRGASLSFLSQYPNEDEVLIPPLSYLEVT